MQRHQSLEKHLQPPEQVIVLTGAAGALALAHEFTGAAGGGNKVSSLHNPCVSCRESS